MVSLEVAGRRFEGIEAIVFDKDGTLANCEAYLTQLTQARVQALGQRVLGIEPLLLATFGLGAAGLNPAGLMAIGSRQDSEIAAAACVTAQGYSWPDSRGIVQEAFVVADAQLSAKAPQTPLISGCREMLDRLRGAGLLLAILSADREANIADWLTHYSLGPYFYARRGSDRPPAKPDPAALLTLCRAIGVDPARVLAIGDASSDMTLARAAGVAGQIGITAGWRSAPDIQGAHGILRDWSGLRLVA